MMKFSKHAYTKVGIVLAMVLGMRTLSFAGNTVSDVPSSANEMRTIQTETTLYNGSCDISQELAFYDGSPVFLRIAQPKGPVSYVFDKAETYVRLYGTVFAGALKFPYISNMVPSTAIDTANTTILTVEAKDGTFDASTMTIPRNQVAGQIISNNMERSLIVNANGANINYYYRHTSDYSLHNGNLLALINPNITKKIACTDYYVARCGDGIVDKSTGTSDGNGGIMTQGGNFLPWHTQSILPNEVCDDGPNNGQPGYCKTDCTGLGQGSPDGASCTLTANNTNIEEGETITLTASYASGTSATFTPSLTGMDNFTYPTWNGTATDEPTTTTTYTLTVQGETGTQPAVCSTTVTVTEPEPHLMCTLTFDQNPMGVNMTGFVNWNITGGNFSSTQIISTPTTVWGIPHTVNYYQFSGSRLIQPTATGSYTFYMTVTNNIESYTCTGLLHVVDDNPFCSLTTSTPTINLGQTGVLNATYANASLAMFTPNIMGLNLTYPTRSNANIEVAPTSTTTYSLNVLSPFGGSGVTCTTTIHVRNTGLNLNKYVINNIQYQEGNLVTFRVNFSNNSEGTITNVEISDYLPLSLDYVSSQIFGVLPPYTFGTGTMPGSHHFVTYSGFSLAPGQEGYLLVVGRYRGNQYANYTINNAFGKGDDTDSVYASALFQTQTPSANATVTKTSNKPSYFPGEAAQFTIAVTNNGPDAINNITINDIRPTSSCVILDDIFSSNLNLTNTITTNPYQRIYNGSLNVGQTLYLYLTGNITNDATCVGTYINNANISYTVNNQTQTGAAPGATFTVSTTPSSYMLFEKRLVSYGNNTGDPVVFELLYQNQGNATITNFDIVDYRPGTLNFVSASPMPATQTPMIGGTELRRYFTNPLAPNGSGKIILQGTIK